MNPTEPTRTGKRLVEAFPKTVFTLDDARAQGFSRHQLELAVNEGAFTRTRHGLYLARDHLESLQEWRQQHVLQCVGVSRVVSNAVVSHESAATLHGLAMGRGPEGGPPEGEVQITVVGSHRTRGPGYLLSGGTLSAEDVVLVDGLPVTSLARTAVDLARKHRNPDGLIVVDAAARRLVCDALAESQDCVALRAAVHDASFVRPAITELRRAVSGMRGWKGVGFARQAIALADPAAESALESVSRFNAHLAGLPLALIGWPVFGQSGRQYWADFLWKKWMVIGEADGRLKYGLDPAVLFAEKEREDDLRRAGYTVVRWTWNDAVSHPSPMVRRLESAFR